jgi:hypothetical protein
MHFRPEWARLNVLYIADRAKHWQPPGDETLLYQNNEFTVWGRSASVRQQAQ